MKGTPNILKNKKILAGIIAAGVIAFLFSPFPGIEAILIEVEKANTSFSQSNVANTHHVFVDVLKNINDNSPNPGLSAEGNWNLQETIPSNAVLAVIFDDGTSNRQECRVTMLGGNIRSDSTSCTAITAITLKRVSDNFDSSSDYKYFGYGYFYVYSYGYKYVAPYTYTYARSGNGTYIYGLTANSGNNGNTFTGDVTAQYDLIIRPAGLSSGTHTIKSVIYDPTDTTFSTFFKSSNIETFTNTLPTASAGQVVPTAGAAFTITAGTESLLLAGTDLPSSITIPSGSTDPELNLSSLITSGACSATSCTLGTGTTATLPGGTSLQIPAGTTISFPAGVTAFDLPRSSTATAGSLGTAGVVLSLGGTDGQRFTFDNPLKLVIAGEGGKSAFFTGTDSSGNAVTREITAICAADDSGVAGGAVDLQLTAGGAVEDCKISGVSGGNLIIYTKHASSIGSFSSSTTSTSTSASASTSGGGGGGGGGGAGAGFSGIKSAPVLYALDFDRCEQNIAKFTVGPASPTVGVKVRTDDGVIPVVKAKDQPFKSKLVFTSKISSDTTFITVEVINTAVPNAPIAKKTINLSECSGSVIVTADEPKTTPVVKDTKDTPKSKPVQTVTSDYKGITHDIDYTMDGEITDITVDEEDMSITFSLANVKGGPLEITLPSSFIHATDGNFMVMVDDELVDYEIVGQTDDGIVLRVNLPAGAEELYIQGTSVVPEFGVLAAAILAIAIVSIVVMSRTQRFAIARI
jgi:predicted secreted protein with PEFG-CTERM motif